MRRLLLGLVLAAAVGSPTAARAAGPVTVGLRSDADGAAVRIVTVGAGEPAALAAHRLELYAVDHEGTERALATHPAEGGVVVWDRTGLPAAHHLIVARVIGPDGVPVQELREAEARAWRPPSAVAGWSGASAPVWLAFVVLTIVTAASFLWGSRVAARRRGDRAGFAGRHDSPTQASLPDRVGRGHDEEAAPVLAWLTVLDGPMRGATFDVTRPNTLVGRDPAGNHTVLNDGRISRRHAELIVHDESVYVRDRGSSGGTYVVVDGVAARVPVDTPVEVPPGGRVRLAQVELRVSPNRATTTMGASA